MSNTRKDGDFNLDQELLSNKAAEAETVVLEDSVEDKTELHENSDFEIQYKINPSLKKKEELINSNIILSVRNLKQFFFFGSGPSRTKLKAVSNVSFDVYNGECFGIVGESGCGKTTTGRSIINLYEITSGSVYYRGYRISAGDRWNRKEIKYTRIHLKEDINKLKDELNQKIASLNINDPEYDSKMVSYKKTYQKEAEKLKNTAYNVIETQKEKIKQIRFDNKHKPRKLMNEIQMIFQDPVDSLDPRMTVEDII
ncbi:MAG: ATP-binding cassette domain-containing protein, partial [Acholeplasmatales bacterium]|nr:ATP-binding cassette domain-containing protein [Acholeplasmatales bacterium]